MVHSHIWICVVVVYLVVSSCVVCGAAKLQFSHLYFLWFITAKPVCLQLFANTESSDNTFVIAL